MANFRSGRLKCSRSGMVAEFPRPRTEKFKRSSVYSGPMVFNEIPSSVRKSIREPSFVQGIRMYFRSKFVLECCASAYESHRRGHSAESVPNLLYLH